MTFSSPPHGRSRRQALRAFATLAALLAVFAPWQALRAQAYPQLHVTELAQRSDRTSVEPGGVFHVTIHVRVAQRRERLDELILGSFDDCEIISNETERTAVPGGGTDFVERLSVQALAPGVATISPAYIDAVDPALGRPMRFSSNALRIEVTGGDPLKAAANSAGDRLRAALRVARDVALRLLLALVIVGCIFAAGFLIFSLFFRRRRRPSAAPPESVIVADPVAAVRVNAGERLARAADAYRSARSPASIAEVRGVLFELAGVPGGATLVDALRGLGDRDGDLRTALVCAEAAAFGPAAERVAAGDAMLAAIAAYGGRTAATADAWTR